MQATLSPSCFLSRTPAFVQFPFRKQARVIYTSSGSVSRFRTKPFVDVDFCQNRHFRLRSSILSQAQQVSRQPQSENVARQPKPPSIRVSKKDTPSNKPLINRLLASKRLSLTFILTAAVLYVTSACLIASAIANAALHGYQRILLFGLGILLPDFRHTLIYYFDVVQDLHEYRPAFRAFAFPSKTKSAALDTRNLEEEPEESLPRPELLWLRKASQDFHEQLRSGFQQGAKQIDKLVGVSGREFANGLTRPIRETGTHFQQLTTGTDLTLRKNVLIATASILLSIAGYLTSTVDPGVGGVSVMLASMLSSAVLSSRRHEMLALLNDGRVMISLVGTLSCAILTFAPLFAAYCFLICCMALVTTRFTVDWLKVFK